MATKAIKLTLKNIQTSKLRSKPCTNNSIIRLNYKKVKMTHVERKILFAQHYLHARFVPSITIQL